ncbi:flagellin [Caballeronia sp. LjRoot34]|uniref:flagellin N-terminal helical domain-containing protein n=1 Tax=Caballeronia sp. LjRoot34 TaxID=3342325 RepID=UPI003ECEECD9
MLSLHTNSASLSIQNTLANTRSALDTSMTRLGTGYRINSAKDDAAGLQIATRLAAQTRGMAVAMQNTQNGMSMLQTADGAFNETGNILLRMKDLATQAADASSTAKDKDAMQAEFDALGAELANIMTNTAYGGEKLLDETGKLSDAMTFQIGAGSAETMEVNVGDLLTALAESFGEVSANYGAPGNAGTELADGANAMIDTINDALEAVGEMRSALGASQNRLEHINNNLANMSSNTTDAQGRIMDVDYAAESANMTSKQILMQASTSMLKQSGSMSQMVLSLLQ